MSGDNSDGNAPFFVIDEEIKSLPDAVRERIIAYVEATTPKKMMRGQAYKCSRDLYLHWAPQGKLDQEQFRVMLLDGKHRMIEEILVSQGTLTSSPVHPREVFREAVRAPAAAIVLCHNHPSGDPAPSADDLEITRRFVAAGEIIGIRVLDHIIIGDGTFCSMSDRG